MEREPMRRMENDSDNMNLPTGKTCGDCVHSRRCTMMFGHIPADEVCDWAPSRFRPIKGINAAKEEVHP